MNIKKLWMFGLGFIASVESAMATVSDGEIVTSKLYVDNELEKKQDAIGDGAHGGSGNNGDVVTYTNTVGTVSSKPVYKETGSYNATQQAALIEANTVNTTVQNGLNRHLTCQRWENDDSSTGNCWIWQINDLTGETFVPHNIQASPS